MDNFKKWYSENGVVNERKKSGVTYRKVNRSELLKFSQIFQRLLFQWSDHMQSTPTKK